MKGGDHVLLSLLSIGVLLVPVAGSLHPGWIAMIVVGTGIGALSPDADADDAAIFHTNRKRPLSTLAAVAGYAIRYFCYYPFALALRICRGDTDALRHRGLLHSVPGVAASSLFVTCGLAGIMLLFDVELFPFLPMTGVAFAAGALLHLIEDTCTVSGVAWLYPFSTDRYCGTLRTGDTWDLRPKVYGGLLAAGIVGLGAAPFLLPSIRGYLPGTGGILLCTLWTVFLAVSGVRLRTSERMGMRKSSYL